VRPVLQQKITSRKQLDGMVERAAREGWEGLILRKDAPYKGIRR
jgi:DNA ligase-1